jgi:hypothetical protein
VSVFVDIAPDESQVDSPAAVVPSGKWRGRLTRAALPLLSVVVFSLVWQLAAAGGIWNQTFVPYPSTVWRAFIDISTTHDGVRDYAGYLLWEHLYMTLRRVFAGVVIGVVLGVLLGLVMGSISWVRSVLEPWLTFLRALPPLAYFFLLVIWLGIDEAPEDHAAGVGCAAAGRRGHDRGGRRRTYRAPGGGPRARRLPPPGDPRHRRSLRAAGDVHRYPARRRHGLLLGGRRRTVQRAARHRRPRQRRQ